MVTVAALIVAARKSAEGVVHVGARFREHEILAENVRGTESIGTGSGINQTTGNNDIVEHLPRVTVGVGAETISEKLPHRVV